jgi:uroporphyrinogen decarboxylase
MERGRAVTHLERWKAAMDRKSFDRLPWFYLGTGEFTESLKAHLGKDLDAILYDSFDIDYRFQGSGMEGKSWEPEYVGPALRTFEDGTFENMWGSRQRLMYYRDGRGAYTETFGYPLADAQTAAEVDRHPWPKAEWFDYQSVLPAIEAFPDYPFMVGYLAIGWFSWEVRGMENVLTDFSLNPAVGEAVIRNIADFGYQYFTRLLEAVKDHIGKNVVAIHIADDWGMQEGLLASPEVFRTFYAPQYRRFTDLAHAHGLKVEFHSCGAARGLYREFAEVGVDIMNPVQTSAKGMVPREIKKEFGKDLCFSGGIDVQQVLPRSTVQQVKDEVKDVLDALGKGGGYIPGPAHNIQYGTPPENVVAMYEAMDEYFGR